MDENLIKKIVDCVIDQVSNLMLDQRDIFEINVMERMQIDSEVKKMVKEHNEIYMPTFVSEESDTDNPNYNEAGVSMIDYGN